MKRRQTGRAIAGAAIIAGITLMLFLVTSLSAIRQAIRGTYDVYAVFDRATGLRVGAPVWIAGDAAGQVTAIEFRPVAHGSTAGVVVTMRLSDDLRAQVRRDSRVRLAAAQFVGDPVVDITPGSNNASILAPGETLYAQPAITQASVMRHAAAFSRALDSLVNAIGALDVPLDRSRRRWDDISARMTGASAELARLRGSLAVRDISADAVMARIHALGTTVQRLQDAFADAERRATDADIRSALAQARRRTSQVAREADELRDLLGRGFLGRMQTDSAIHLAIRRAQAQLDSLISETKQNPLRYWLGDPDKTVGY